jgi:hypothetical protein
MVKIHGTCVYHKHYNYNYILFIPPGRWPYEWPKHVGGHRVIKLQQYTCVHM